MLTWCQPIRLGRPEYRYPPLRTQAWRGFVRSPGIFPFKGGMRRLRYVPEGGALVEVTCRTLHSRFFFRPGRNVNDIIIGVLAQAQQTYPIRICAYSFLSGHFHLLLDVDDAEQLAGCVAHLP